MADQGGRYSEMITQLLRHVTSQSHDADVKEDIFKRTIYPPSLVVIAFYILVVRGEGRAESVPPGRRRPRMPGLYRVKQYRTMKNGVQHSLC